MQNCPGDKKFKHTLVCLFGLMLNAPINSYGHVETVSSSNHTFSPGQAYQYFVHLIDNIPSWISGREAVNGRINYFMVKSPRKYGNRPGANSQHLDLQLDTYLQPDTVDTLPSRCAAL